MTLRLQIAAVILIPLIAVLSLLAAAGLTGPTAPTRILLNVIVITGLASALVAAIAVSRSFAKRIERVEAHARSYMSGDEIAEKDLVRGSDEVAELDATLRTMA